MTSCPIRQHLRAAALSSIEVQAKMLAWQRCIGLQHLPTKKHGQKKILKSQGNQLRYVFHSLSPNMSIQSVMQWQLASMIFTNNEFVCQYLRALEKSLKKKKKDAAETE